VQGRHDVSFLRLESVGPLVTSRASGRRGIGGSILFESWQDEVQTQSLLRPAPGSNISRAEFSGGLVDAGGDFRNGY
jgi:hypothetical protein